MHHSVGVHSIQGHQGDLSGDTIEGRANVEGRFLTFLNSYGTYLTHRLTKAIYILASMAGHLLKPSRFLGSQSTGLRVVTLHLLFWIL
jgi:hypothetical protein